MPIAAEDLDFESRLRLLMLGEPKGGKTTCAVSTSPGPVRVLLCEDVSALREAKRRSPRGHFDVEQVSGWNSMQKALAEAKEDAKAGHIKTLIIDPLSDFADKLLAECFKLTLTREGNEDGRKAYPECTKRLKHVIEQLFAMPCHVIVISHHMVTGGELGEGVEKTGEGIVPLLPGAARRVVGAKFVDVVWFEMKMVKGADGKMKEERSIVCGPKGAWTYGCRSLPGAEVLPDNMTTLIERFNKQLREDKRPVQNRPALRPVASNNNARR
jgi:AAA domain